MNKTLITVAVATLALSSATLATADETVAVVAPTPIISGAVSLDFAETAANKTAGTMGVELDIVKKSGSWFSYGETRLGQGRDAVKTLLLDNLELMEELEAGIKAALSDEPAEEVVEPLEA